MKFKIFPIIILFILMIPSFWFLLKPGIYWNMHDDMQLVRQLEMEKCFSDGQIPCRWTPDLGYGYGYPLFNYYPPLPYYIGQIFRFTGLSFITSVKLTAALQFILAGYFMYLLAAGIFGTFGGILSALFYTYAPYHAVNIYVRGAMNEAWASVFFPLIFYFSKKYIIDKQKTSLFLLSISFSLLMLSHNPMVLIFSPLVLIWSLFWIFQQKTNHKLSTILYLSYSVILSFCLSAFFTLPVLIESKLVQIESMFTNYYHYSIHFVSLYQLFISNFWGDGPSLWGPNDGMSFSIGYLHWIIPLLLTIYIFIKIIKRQILSRLDWLILLICSLGLFSAFMSHERSTFIWQLLTPLQKVQFPWRFLNITTFLFSLAIGYSSLVLKNFKVHTQLIIFTIIIAVVFILNLNHFTPVTSGPITDSQKFSGLAWTNQVTGGIYDYLPKTASTAPKSPAKDYVDEILGDNVTSKISGQKKGTDWLYFDINLSVHATIYLPVLAFPDFHLYVDNRLSDYKIEPKLGRISVDLPSGNHQIYLKLKNTPIRTIANTISFMALLFTLFSLFTLWIKRK